MIKPSHEGPQCTPEYCMNVQRELLDRMTAMEAQRDERWIWLEQRLHKIEQLEARISKIETRLLLATGLVAGFSSSAGTGIGYLLTKLLT